MVELRGAMLVDVEKGDVGRVVLDHAHVDGEADEARQGEVQIALSGHLLLGQVGVGHAHELHDVLLLAAVGKGGLAHDEEAMDLAVVAAYADASRVRVVLLQRLVAGQEAADAHVVVACGIRHSPGISMSAVDEQNCVIRRNFSSSS